MILLFKGQNCPDGLKIQKTKKAKRGKYFCLTLFFNWVYDCEPLTRGNVLSLPQMYFTLWGEPTEIIQKREVPSN